MRRLKKRLAELVDDETCCRHADTAALREWVADHLCTNQANLYSLLQRIEALETARIPLLTPGSN